MSLLKEVWITDAQEQLFENYTFLDHSVNHAPFVVGSVVHVPAAGTAPATVRNRSSLPATVTSRTDAMVSYSVDSRSTDPVVVPDLEAFQLSYDKRQSVMGQHLEKLMADAVRDVVQTWSPTLGVRLVRTSGSPSTLSLAPGATGNRKAIALADVSNLARKFDEDNMPQEGRFLMLNPAQYYELFSLDQLLRADVMGRATLPKGAITQLFGFNIMVKPTLPVYSNAATPVLQDVGAATAFTDNLCALAWHKSAVARAIGGIEVYENEKDATFYGDVISASLFAGGCKLRTSQAGVAALVQAA